MHQMKLITCANKLQPFLLSKHPLCMATQETPSGHKYIMTITDYYTKWAEAAALKDKSASIISYKCLVLCKFSINSFAENDFPSLTTTYSCIGNVQ